MTSKAQLESDLCLQFSILGEGGFFAIRIPRDDNDLSTSMLALEGDTTPARGRQTPRWLSGGGMDRGIGANESTTTRLR